MKQNKKNEIYVDGEFPKVYGETRNGKFGAFYPELRDRIKLIHEMNPVIFEVKYNELIDVINQFKDLVKSNDYTVLDTETTGRSTQENCVIEVGITDYDDSILIEEMYNSDIKIGKGAFGVHNISQSEIDGKKFMIEDFDRIVKAANSRGRIVIYNHEYDIPIMETTLIKQFEKVNALRSMDEITAKVFDPMKMFACIAFKWNSSKNGFRWPKLNGQHRAYLDCIDTNKWIKFAAGIDLSAVEASKQEALASLEVKKSKKVTKKKSSKKKSSKKKSSKKASKKLE